MSNRELVLMTCRSLQIRDPAELYALPDGLADEWIEITRREWVGWYEPQKGG